MRLTVQQIAVAVHVHVLEPCHQIVAADESSKNQACAYLLNYIESRTYRSKLIFIRYSI